MRDSPGFAGAPPPKRAELMNLVLELVSLPSVELGLLRRTVALFIHPYMHRKCFMCVFHRVFVWMATLREGQLTRWPPDVREELLAAAMLLPLCHAHLRWQVSERLSSTDATPTRGGATCCNVGSALAEELFRQAEQRGCYTRLDGLTEDADHLLPPQAEVAALCRAMSWEVTRSHPFKAGAHINLQELGETRLELQCLCADDPRPLRVLNATDSQVSLGAWAKGRSASVPINNLLRRSLGWRILGRKEVDQFRLDTKSIPADDPSREVLLRAPEEAPDWMPPLFASGRTFPAYNDNVLNAPCAPFGFPCSLGDGERLGDLLRPLVWVSVGDRARRLRYGPTRSRVLWGRHAPFPGNSAEWSGRGHWAWARHWKSLEVDAGEHLASVVVAHLGPSLAPLTRDRGIYETPPQPLPVSENWWERLGEKDKCDSPEERARAKSRAMAQARWDAEHGVALFGAIAAHVFTTVLTQRGGLFIYGQASAAAWQALPLAFYSTVLTVDMVLYGPKAGRVVRRGGRGRKGCCCLLACSVCVNLPTPPSSSNHSSQTPVNSGLSPVSTQPNNPVCFNASSPVVPVPSVRPASPSPSSLVNRDSGFDQCVPVPGPVDSFGVIAAPSTPRPSSNWPAKLDCSWVKDNRHSPDFSIIRISSLRYPVFELIDTFRIIYDINKFRNHHSPRAALQLFEECIVTVGSRWLGSRRDLSRFD